MKYGFVRVAAAVPELRVADCPFNVRHIEQLIRKANQEQVQVICFPELSITGYTCADLFFQNKLLEEANSALSELVKNTSELNIISVVGMLVKIENRLYNTAVVFAGGKIIGVVPKVNLPNHNEFYEKRWFSSGNDLVQQHINFLHETVPVSSNLVFRCNGFNFGIEICEDLWMPIPQSSHLALNGADIIFNLSASNELIGKNNYRSDLVLQQSARCIAGYVYASAGHGESTTDLVFSGSSFIAENGVMLEKGECFSLDSQLIISDIDVERLQHDRLKNTNFFNNASVASACFIDVHEKWSEQNRDIENSGKLFRSIYPHPFVPSVENRNKNCKEIFSIQTGGIAKRWQHTGLENLIIGISGGLDSTLALLVCVKTADKLGYDRHRIWGITMPGFGTTNRTYRNATKLMEALGITAKEISIKDASLHHFKDIGHNPDVHDVTYENVQARERTQILMDLANKHNGMVVGTGDLSEIALGWSTYNGDHMSMYGVNAGVPKTLVRYLVSWVTEQFDADTGGVLRDILATPVSPELLPISTKNKITQKTEDILGPYELHDFFLYYLVRFGFTPEKIRFLAMQAFKDKYSKDIIEKWLKLFLRRFSQQQFKRSCMPDGPKVGSINLSPRGDWRMPSDAIPFELTDKDEDMLSGVSD